MDSIKKGQDCQCGSGRLLSECCGVEGRTALSVDLLAKLDNEGNVLEGGLTEQLTTSVTQAATSPDMFFARYNFLEERAYMVKMSEQYYQDSVFLDPGRIKGTCVIESNFKWIESITDTIALQKMPIIFHTAFCGSTLMSQALHAVFNVLSLREPECLSNSLELLRSPLRSPTYKDQWLDIVLKLLSKRYQPETVTVVKTNDYSNPMMFEILNRYSQTPFLFMYTPLAEFVVGCLKDKGRQKWIKSRYQSTLAHTDQLLPNELRPKIIAIGNQAYGEMAAFYWSYNIALFFQSWRSQPERIRCLDFNVMLSDPVQAIEACGKWFGLSKLPDENTTEKVNTLFSMHSKNSSKTYSPNQRRDDLQKQFADYAGELEKAKQFSQKLLSDDYPTAGLPAGLLDG